MEGRYHPLDTINRVYIKILSFNLNPTTGLNSHSLIDVSIGPQKTYSSHSIRVRNGYQSVYKIWDYSVCNPSKASFIVAFRIPRPFHQPREIATSKVCLDDFRPNAVTNRQIQLYSENGTPIGSCIIAVHLSCDGTEHFQI